MTIRGHALPRLNLPSAVVMALLFTLPFAFLLYGQGRPAQKIGFPDDWTHHRLVFSDPGTAQDAIRNGTSDRWVKITGDPRYLLQRRKRDAAAKGALNFDKVLPPPDVQRFVESDNRDRFSPSGNKRLPRGLTPAASVPFPHFDFRRLPRRPEHSHERTPQSLHKDWSENMGAGATVGLGMFPAKYSFDISTTNCDNAAQPDFVVYNTSLQGSNSKASVIAYTNLYTGCSGDGDAVPTTYWAYNTGGAVVTSVVLSQDGTQVAFAQTNSSGAASLVILKWKKSTGTAGSPAAPTAETTSSYRGCPVPCSVTINFSGSGTVTDTASSAFPDYGSDSIYVGDNSGHLHKFTGVFQGTPGEIVTNPWPVPVSSAALGEPVLDPGTGNIFVGDYSPTLEATCGAPGESCGHLYSVSSSSGTIVGSSAQLDYNFGIVDGPLVDSSAGSAYVFVGADSSFGSASACGTDVPCSGVFQFPTNFTSGSGSEATVGSGYQFLLSGSFDNQYFSSGNSALPTGHLYVVGNTGPANNALFQISINANVMSASAVAGPTVSDNYSSGSLFSAGLQITEIFTGAKDYVFLSVLSYGAPATCSSSLTNGCVMGFDVTSGTITSGTTPTGATAEADGTSGIIIDNISAFSGASNIYYTPLGDQPCDSGTGGCAIQILQISP